MRLLCVWIACLISCICLRLTVHTRTRACAHTRDIPLTDIYVVCEPAHASHPPPPPNPFFFPSLPGCAFGWGKVRILCNTYASKFEGIHLYIYIYAYTTYPQRRIRIHIYLETRETGRLTKVHTHAPRRAETHTPTTITTTISGH